MIPFPDVDSTDLTDEEVASAISLKDREEFKSELIRQIHLSCGSCGATPMILTKQERRRRKPLEFSRVTLRCPRGHEVRRLLIRTWVNT